MRTRLRSRAGSPPTGRGESDEIERLRGIYLDLTKRALTHLLYRPLDINIADTGDYQAAELREAAAEEMSRPGFDWAVVRREGRDWPLFAQTMIGLDRLDNVQQCVETTIADGVPGDLIETGVWRGGASILMRAVLEAYGDSTRTVFAADSFRGLPPPDADAYPSDAGSRLHEASALAVSLVDVKRNFSLYGLLDDQVEFLEGWFKDTLPTVRDRTWAVIRLDGDMYESTMDALVNLYPQMSVGGFVIIDDYGYEPCGRAVADYRAEHGISEPIVEIDWLGAYWRRER